MRSPSPGAWVEEVLRREPPVVSWRRVTARPPELGGGVELPAGAELLLMLVGSGSAPVVFGSPGQVVPAARTFSIASPSPWGAPPPWRGPVRTEAVVTLCGAARRLPVRLGPYAAVAPALGPLSFRAPLLAPSSTR
ncbi:hypothetical protein GT043_30855 [Streptomyces sp. SID2131]|nr:hypothetical protein [Streptomyces sp. SID2131]